MKKKPVCLFFSLEIGLLTILTDILHICHIHLVYTQIIPSSISIIAT